MGARLVDLAGRRPRRYGSTAESVSGGVSLEVPSRYRRLTSSTGMPPPRGLDESM
jgi:hypothetical protein